MITLNKYVNYSAMTKAEFAILIDSYADAKTSGNKYLVKKMIEDLEGALNELFGEEPVSGPEIADAPEAPGEY
jgi:hypothetical protein